MHRREACSTPFPYTTLFRSGGDGIAVRRHGGQARVRRGGGRRQHLRHAESVAIEAVALEARGAAVDRGGPDEIRSEEHTSELQSHSDLVCRLLLEKKNRKPL